MSEKWSSEHGNPNMSFRYITRKGKCILLKDRVMQHSASENTDMDDNIWNLYGHKSFQYLRHQK